MIFLIGFAFVAGIFTVLSPCILPVLPALLSAGTLQGRLRPFGVVIGLICSFTFFTLTLTLIIQTTGLSANVLRYIAIALIFLFGLVMIFPKLSNWFAKITTSVATLGQKALETQHSSGFWGGFLFGAALGLVWAPCAGPILAAITTLVATHMLNAAAVWITLAYSIGAGIPMLLIAYGGGKIIQSSRFLSRHSEGIRQFFGCLMLLFAIALYFRWEMLYEQKLARYLPSGLVENHPRLEQELAKIRGESNVPLIMPSTELVLLGNAPGLTGIVKWINSPPLTLEQLKGKVVLIDFWTYSCINCLRTLPYIKNWDATYRNQGLVIIGVHTPEFEFEKDPDNVAKAVKDLGVAYPVALDNNYATWNAYHNRYWPAHYLIDKEGMLRMVHHGEGAYVETENGIRTLLGIAPMVKEEPTASTLPLSPETYLGTARAEHYAPEIHIEAHQVATYSYTPTLKESTVGLKGSWRIEKEYIESESNESYLDLHFVGKQAYLVLSGSSATPMQIYLDGKLSKEVIVDTDKKYDIANTSYGNHQVSIKVPQRVRAYAFTFGNE